MSMYELTKNRTDSSVKMAAVSSFPEEAWKVSGEDSDIEELAKIVSWLYGVQHKRAGVTSTLPIELRRGDDAIDKQDWPIKMDIVDLLYRYSLAMDLHAENYMFKVMQGMSVIGVKWLDPDTITIEENEEVGLLGFTRTLGAKKKLYPVKDGMSQVMWTWLPGLVEIGPGAPPVGPVEDAAHVLRYMTLTSKGFFEKGAIGTWLLFGPQASIPPEQRTRFGKWWKRVLSGLGNQGSMEVLAPEARVEQLNSPVSDWVLPDLNEILAEQICVAHDTPLMLMRPEQGSDKAMMEQTRLQWINETIIPHAQRLIDTLNEQLFYDLGYEWVINAESMNVNQEEEHKKSVSYGNYVNAYIAALNANSPELLIVAAETLGIDLPDDAIAVFEKLAADKEARAAEMAESMAQAAQPEDSDDEQERQNEFKVLDKFISNGSHNTRLFKSEILEPWEIRERIEDYEYERYNANGKTYRP